MELNEKWKEQAENEFHYEMHKTGFIKGAQTYADAVEKMLKKEIAERTQAMSKLSNRVSILAQITTLNKLLEELKLIQP